MAAPPRATVPGELRAVRQQAVRFHFLLISLMLSHMHPPVASFSEFSFLTQKVAEWPKIERG